MIRNPKIRNGQMAKSIVIRAWASVGNHGKPFVTTYSAHEACVGRFEIYATKGDARRQAAREDLVKRCTIRVER